MRALLSLWLLTSGLILSLTVADEPQGTTAGQNSASCKKLPNALIIGSAKAGTSALLHMLALHPDVAAATNGSDAPGAIPDDEIYFFGGHRSQYRRGLEWYRTQMPEGSCTKRVVIEKTTLYFTTTAVPSRVRDFNSSIKLLLVVREPVAKTVSLYTHSVDVTSGVTHLWFPPASFPDSEPLPSFEDIFPVDWWSSRSRKRSAHVMRYARVRKLLLKFSMYAKYLRGWLAVFPREQILVLDGDELARQPWAVLQSACEFLGLDLKLISRDSFYLNETKGQFCWRGEGGETKGTCLDHRKGRAHPQVDPRVQESLKQFFRPHNEEFFTLVGRSFPWN